MKTLCYCSRSLAATCFLIAGMGSLLKANGLLGSGLMIGGFCLFMSTLFEAIAFENEQEKSQKLETEN